MTPLDHRTPWQAMRRWPSDRPLCASLDLAPDAPCRGVTLATPAAAMDLQPAGLGGALDPAQHRPKLVWLSYDLGHAFEPAAPPADPSPSWKMGQIISLAETQHFDCDESAWRHSPAASEADPAFDIAPFNHELGRDRFLRAAHEVLEYIRAGDVYQVNLTHRLRTELRGSPRAFAAALFESALPWHGAYIETTSPAGRRQVIVSVSPELFLDFDPATRIVRTRPMKGTRPASSDEAELFHAAKDRAELNMIIDLMRNDLGRASEMGSVRVEQDRTIERHGDSVLQATATISGRVCHGLGLADLLAATFPPGSVTGAPKIRAMQIIHELEHAPRGPYCGSIGLITTSGRARLNVAIRTALLTETDEPDQWTLDYHVGAGIVADSDPNAEWRETLDKADVLLRLARPAGVR